MNVNYIYCTTIILMVYFIYLLINCLYSNLNSKNNYKKLIPVVIAALAWYSPLRFTCLLQPSTTPSFPRPVQPLAFLDQCNPLLLPASVTPYLTQPNTTPHHLPYIFYDLGVGGGRGGVVLAWQGKLKLKTYNFFIRK